MAELEVNVNYSVKELLAKMDTKLDLALAQLVSKADEEHVRSLEIRISSLEGFRSRAYGALITLTTFVAAGGIKLFLLH